jgi:hypothetical protein
MQTRSSRKLLATKTTRAAGSSKAKSSSAKATKQNNRIIANEMMDSLAGKLTASDSTTSSSLGVPQPNQDGEFIRFPKLPAELRQEIWTLSLPGPRDILIHLDPQDMRTMDVSDIKEDEHTYYRAKAYAGPVPAHLHINQESRAVAKIYYGLGFEDQTRGRPIYVDFKVDTICFSNYEAVYAFYGRNLTKRWKNTEQDLEYMKKEEAKIQSLIFMGQPSIDFYLVRKVLRRFSNLDKLVFKGAGHRGLNQERWYRSYLDISIREAKKSAENLGISFKEPRIEFLLETF